VGERHGFEIFKKTDHDPRLFVVSKDIKKNTITVSSKSESRTTNYESRIKVPGIHWISGRAPNLKETFDIRFRYRQEKQKCKIVRLNESYEIIPDTPQFGIAPGQSAVVYSGDVCLGGGILE